MRLWPWLVAALLFAALAALLMPMTVQLPLGASHGCGPALEWNVIRDLHGTGATACRQAATGHLVSAICFAVAAMVAGVIGAAASPRR